MAEQVHVHNPFYRAKWQAAGFDSPPTLDDLRDLPFTTKAELAGDQDANPAPGQQPDLPVRPLRPRPPHLGDDRQAAALVRHPGKLAVVPRLLARDLQGSRRRPRRPGLRGLRLRPLRRLLDRIRGCPAAWLPRHAGRSPEHRTAAARHAGRRGDGARGDPDLRLAPPGGRGRAGPRPGRKLHRADDPRRRTGRRGPRGETPPGRGLRRACLRSCRGHRGRGLGPPLRRRRTPAHPGRRVHRRVVGQGNRRAPEAARSRSGRRRRHRTGPRRTRADEPRPHRQPGRPLPHRRRRTTRRRRLLLRPTDDVPRRRRPRPSRRHVHRPRRQRLPERRRRPDPRNRRRRRVPRDRPPQPPDDRSRTGDRTRTRQRRRPPAVTSAGTPRTPPQPPRPGTDQRPRLAPPASN